MNRAAHSRRKMSVADVAEARRAYEDGATYSELAARYGVGGQTIYDAVRGHSYKDVAAPIPEARARGGYHA